MTLKRTLNRLRMISFWLMPLWAATLTQSVAAAEPAPATSPAAQEAQLRLDAMLNAVTLPAAEAVNILRPSVDFAAISRSVMGKHGREASPEQKARFAEIFAISMVGLLKSATQSVGEFNVVVEKASISPKNNARAQVQASVALEGSPNLALIAAMANTDGVWMVRNLVFDGVNLGRTYRNQFEQLLLENDNSLDAAINAWADQVNTPTP